MATKNQLRVPDTNHKKEHSLRDAITFVLGLLGMHASATNKAKNTATNGNHPDMKENEPKPVLGGYKLGKRIEVDDPVLGEVITYEVIFDENEYRLSDGLAKEMRKDSSLRKRATELRPDINDDDG